MADQKQEAFINRLQKMRRHLGRQARRQGVTCYRVYDHDLPEFPLCIEIYEDKIYVAEYRRRHGMEEAAHEAWLSQTIDLLAAFFETPPDNIFTKTRQRKAGRQAQYQKTAMLGEEWAIRENGLQFLVNLSDYLDTGLFLDHRLTRQMVREHSHQKSVLNLFAYTGSFSVYAAAGGARLIHTVDLSNTYLEWAQRNMRLNGFDTGPHNDFFAADVLQHIKTLSPHTYDLIILDPPTFSNSKKMKAFLDIQEDHPWLINQCLQLLRPGGELFFSTNHRRFRLMREELQATEMKDITRATTPFDFEGRLHRLCYLIRP